ncbi:MAG: hypothetical protein CMO81_03220 [Waddliaceae bacterium]|nr:hypothetical protein [Waddliaceae bacterium]
MSSQRQITANRANAKRSSGPKSSRGKASSSQNALKHGALSQQIVIAGESIKDYENLHEKLLEDLKPEGELERLLVDKITIYAWRLRRIIYIESAMFSDRLKYEHDSFASEKMFEGFTLQKLSAMNRYETAISRQFYRAAKQLQELQQNRLKDIHQRTDFSLYREIGFV